MRRFVSQPYFRRPATLVLAGILLTGATLLTGCSKKQPVTPVDAGATHTRDVSPQLGSGDDSGSRTVAMDSNPAARVDTDLGAVYFDFDRADLSADAVQQLQKNAAYLVQHADVTVLIEGHCDEFGTDEYNLALGERRAAAARDFLVRQGIAASRLRTVSYGEGRPFCFDSTASCWPLNRRAHFVVATSSTLG